MMWGPLPGIANTIECSVPDEQSVVSALTPMIACRSEPAPLSLVLVTVKVVAHAGEQSPATNRARTSLAIRACARARTRPALEDVSPTAKPCRSVEGA